MINYVVEKIQGLFSLPILFLFIFIGGFLLLADVPMLKRKEYDREASIAKLMGYVYIGGSIVAYIIFQII